MAMFAAFSSTIMEAAFGRLHNNGTGAGSIVGESIVVGEKAANININDSFKTYYTCTEITESTN